MNNAYSDAGCAAKPAEAPTLNMQDMSKTNVQGIQGSLGSIRNYRPSAVQEMEKEYSRNCERQESLAQGLNFLTKHPDFSEFIRLVRLGAISFLVICAVSMSAQTVKSSPASDALNHAAKDAVTEQQSFDVMLNQAKSSADASNKALQSKLGELNKALLDQLKADKKYKSQLEEIDTVQKQLQTLNQTATQKFQQEAGPIQNAIGRDKALIEGLIPIVRKENDLPDTATYDQSTQKWTTPAAKK